MDSITGREHGEITSAARAYQPDYPTFRQLGRTGASRYAPVNRGDKYGRVFTYSPDSISFQEYDEMRMDGQIRAGLTLIKLPIVQASWSISCEDPDIAAFCRQVIKPIWPTMMRQILLGLDFGFSAFEKLWTVAYGYKVTQNQASSGGDKQRVYPNAVILRNLLHLDPTTIYLLAYRWSGEFAGVRQYVANSAVIPAEKCFLYSNEHEFSEWYGVSRQKPCYPYWVFKKLIYDYTNVFYETYSIPTKVGRYPIGRTEVGQDVNGNPLFENNRDIMAAVMHDIRNNSEIVIPNVFTQDGVQQWDIDTLESNRTGGDHIAYIDHLNLMILKSLLVPQLALEIGSSGSYSLAETQVNFFLTGEQALMDQIGQAIDTFILKQLVKYNFGPNAPEATIKFTPLAGDLRDGIMNVLMQTLGNGQAIPMEDGSAIEPDWKWIAEELGVPLKTVSKEDMEKRKSEEMAAQGMLPQDQEGQIGQPNQGQFNGQQGGMQSQDQGGQGLQQQVSEPEVGTGDVNTSEFGMVVDKIGGVSSIRIVKNVDGEKELHLV